MAFIVIVGPLDELNRKMQDVGQKINNLPRHVHIRRSKGFTGYINAYFIFVAMNMEF